MMKLRLRSAAFALVGLGLGALGCAPNLCQRKATHFESCRASTVTYAEPGCEDNLDRCSEAERKVLEAYVACLEGLAECSLEANAKCAAAHPRAVNMTCTGG